MPVQRPWTLKELGTAPLELLVYSLFLSRQNKKSLVSRLLKKSIEAQSLDKRYEILWFKVSVNPVFITSVSKMSILI
jgi:hypothetical protein